MVERIVALGRDEQSVHHDGELACHRRDRAFLALASTAAANALPEATQLAVRTEGPHGAIP